jgi:predicted aspartyl protease
MGTFRVDVTVSNAREPTRSRTLPLLVDPGATYAILPRDVLEALGSAS